MSDLSKIIQFYKECYQADNRELNLWDIFSLKHGFLKIFDEDELHRLSNDAKLRLEDGVYTSDLANRLKKYKRENKLIVVSHFLVAKLRNLDSFSEYKHKLVCAPLIMYEAKLEESDKGYSVSYDPQNFQWNSSLFSEFIENRDELYELDEYVNDIEKIGNWLSNKIGDVQFEVFNTLPDVNALKSLKRSGTIKSFKLIRGSGMLVVNRSTSSMGIIHDLEKMISDKEGSHPILDLFDQSNQLKKKYTSAKYEYVPGILSEAQKKCIHNAAEKTISQIVGPPGTGKSYTIASIALERYMRNESVLIVSQNEYAIDVIKQMLVRKMGLSSDVIIRAGNTDYLRKLKKYLSDLKSGLLNLTPIPFEERDFQSVNKKIKQLENDFSQLSQKEVKRGIKASRILENDFSSLGFIGKLRFIITRKRTLKRRRLFFQTDQLEKLHKKREKKLIANINQKHFGKIEELAIYNRKEITTLLNGIKARTSSRQEKMFDNLDFSLILDAMPIWMCSLNSLHKSLPLDKNLFDLVIIDEATQCNISSCLPALQRAKKAVIVGDPKQLRHISFLSKKRQEQIFNKLNIEGIHFPLDYRSQSMIDLADNAISSQEAVVVLDEHYRSLPQIINFSNKNFYNSHLRIMTEKPSVNQSSPVEIIHCEGNRKKGVNREEGIRIIKKVKELIKSQKDLPAEYKLSIGVLSFFREQSDFLQNLLLEEIDLDDLSAHQLRAGTPYGFQGEERDIMLISLAIDDKVTAGSYTYLNRPDVLNVAITRAREMQLIYFSSSIQLLPKENLLRRYLESIGEFINSKTHKKSLRDHYINDLTKALHKVEIEALPGYPIAGISMDLVAVFKGKSLAIDLIGFPGEYEDAFHLDRYKIFERAGLQIFPLSLTEWIFCRDEILNRIKEILEIQLNESELEVTAESLSGHWHKLLAINSELAKDVRLVEMDLSDCDEEICIDQIGQLLTAYQKFFLVINEKLNPDEITYKRYLKIANQLIKHCVDHFKKIVLLKKSLPETVIELEEDESRQLEIKVLVENQLRVIDQLKRNINKAINDLQKITITWSQADLSKNNDTTLQSILEELNHLNDQIKKYETQSTTS